MMQDLMHAWRLLLQTEREIVGQQFEAIKVTSSSGTGFIGFKTLKQTAAAQGWLFTETDMRHLAKIYRCDIDGFTIQQYHLLAIV